MVSLLIPLMIAGGFDGVEPLRDSAAPREILAAQPRQTACRKAKPVLKKETRTQVVYRGLTQAARLLGCSRPHLSYVLHGQRKPSQKLARGLRRMGIEVGVA